MKENGAGRRLLIVASFWWVERLADRVCAFRGHGRTAAEKLDLALAFGWRNTSALRFLLGWRNTSALRFLFGWRSASALR